MVNVAFPMLLAPFPYEAKKFGDLQLALSVMEAVNHWSKFSVNFNCCGELSD